MEWMRLVGWVVFKRLAVLFAVIVVVIGVCWWSMIRMPLRSFSGRLPALGADQSALRDALRGHVEKLAGEIGERNVYSPHLLSATAPFRYPHYHTEEDAPDKIDYERLARVVDGLDRVVAELVGN